jgi:Sorting nexin C terminal
LKPTLRLIEYAGSPSREKQSILLRDLKLGVTHLDRAQLQRNALLSPRYPTELVDLAAVVEDVIDGSDSKGVDLFGGSTSVFTIKCTAVVTLVASDKELVGDTSYQTEHDAFAETYKEEWVISRTMNEFQKFHKHLKQQVNMAESSGTAGSRLVGAAAAAFSTATLGKSRQKRMLIPSLSSASKTGALGVGGKKLTKRKEILDTYLGYLLSPGHLLGRCSELLLFLGASFPLSPEVQVGGEAVHSQSDPLGRTSMTRSILRLRPAMSARWTEDAAVGGASAGLESPLPQRRVSRLTSMNSVQSIESQDDDPMLMDDDEDGSGDFIPGRRLAASLSSSMMIPAVKHKIDKIMLSQVRNRIFELLRYQFGFENASFARNRLLAALKTASFAVTTPAEFRKLLYKIHTEHLNSEAVSGWIHFLIDTLWPNGVFFEAQPVPSREEYQAQAAHAKELLHSSFPDQVRAILGQDLTRDGMDILYEMLQNRLVVKSMAYMLFDLLWLEVFPEIGDVLPCGAALDIDS